MGKLRSTFGASWGSNAPGHAKPAKGQQHPAERTTPPPARFSVLPAEGVGMRVRRTQEDWRAIVQLPRCSGSSDIRSKSREEDTATEREETMRRVAELKVLI